MLHFEIESAMAAKRQLEWRRIGLLTCIGLGGCGVTCCATQRLQ